LDNQETDQDENDNVVSSTSTLLPSNSVSRGIFELGRLGTYLQKCVFAMQMDGLWESLIFDDDIMSKLLSYVSTALLFAGMCL
jgi:meiotically up-regulated gene 157 (Mug157) protein